MPRLTFKTSVCLFPVTKYWDCRGFRYVVLIWFTDLFKRGGLFFITVHFVKSLCLPQKISTKPHQNLFTLGGDSPKASGWYRVQKCEWRGNEEKSLMPCTFGYFKEQWLYHFPWMQLQEMNNAEELSEMSLQTFTHLLPSWASPLPPCTHYSKMCFL